MKIAIFGATSEIAKDLICSFNKNTDYVCDLFVRNFDEAYPLFDNLSKEKFIFKSYDEFSDQNKYDVLFNFVGVGDPSKTKSMGADIFDITYKYDSLALDYIRKNKDCKYIFLSSGAVYGGSFSEPVSDKTEAYIDINNLQPTDWYTIAKLHAEARHRSMPEFSIIDLRVFNYFSHTQDMNARFLITDIVRAIKNNEMLKTSERNIVRDFITPKDFFSLVQCLIGLSKKNLAIDCRTKSPIDKITLLKKFYDSYHLKYEFVADSHLNATGLKINYYSKSSKIDFIGFKPFFSSVNGLIFEINKIID